MNDRLRACNFNIVTLGIEGKGKTASEWLGFKMKLETENGSTTRPIAESTRLKQSSQGSSRSVDVAGCAQAKRLDHLSGH